MTKNTIPWFLVEVKTAANQSLNPNLAFFQKHTGAAHAFQVVFDLPYLDKDCFAREDPVKVPLTIFLSQLV